MSITVRMWPGIREMRMCTEPQDLGPEEACRNLLTLGKKFFLS